ncbi:MAG: hypothetical protein ACKOPE_13305 [Novosphingobium sp.]
MSVIVGFLVAAVIGLILVQVLCRKGGISLDRHPWLLEEAAKLHVHILGGLAGFAFTGVVLIVTFAQERGGSTDPSLDTVVVMFLVAFLWWIGGAFLISFHPHKEASGDLVPRIHFSLATTLEYRTVFLSWFALPPLLNANGLGRLEPTIGFLLLVSMACGSVLVAMIADGLGLIRVRETYLSALVAMILTLTFALVARIARLDTGSDYWSLHMALVIFVINGIGFALASASPLAPRYAAVRSFFERHGRRIVVADMQLTMLSLSFLCFSVLGFF